MIHRNRNLPIIFKNRFKVSFQWLG